MSRIDSENWGFCHFKSGKVLASIFIGAAPGPKSKSAIREIYCVTTTNTELEKSFFHRDFNNLDKALDFINSRYGHWEFINRNLIPAKSCSKEITA